MPTPEITPLLEKAHAGDRDALNDLARIVHGDMIRVAKNMMFREHGRRAGRLTLEPASLVNETFIKLLGQRTEYKNREHFFAIATKVMLRVLLDYHKARRRRKRGPDQLRVSLSVLDRTRTVEPGVAVPELIASLERLEELDPRFAKVTKLRALWGLSSQETAEVLGVSKSTVDRDWRFARAWLAANL